MKNNAPLIKIDKIILRLPEEKDIETRYHYGRPIQFRQMSGGSMTNIPPFTKEDSLAWYNKVSDHECTWIIDLNGTMIGTARITQLDNEHARYAIGIFEEKFYNHGIGTKVTKAIIDYIFNHTTINHIDLLVLEFNKRAIACYKKCGFKDEKVLIDNVNIDNTHYNQIIMAINK